LVTERFAVHVTVVVGAEPVRLNTLPARLLPVKTLVPPGAHELEPHDPGAGVAVIFKTITWLVFRGSIVLTLTRDPTTSTVAAAFAFVDPGGAGGGTMDAVTLPETANGTVVKKEFGFELPGVWFVRVTVNSVLCPAFAVAGETVSE
jgi:hypothetical protein